jgi:DNA-binding SARP family transcriptional activator
VGAALRVRVLGGLAVEGFTEHDLGSRKGRLLLKVLALGRGRAVSVDRLADIVWAEGELPAKPAEQIGVLVSRLRRVVGQDRVVRTDAGYALLADWLDLDDLAARVD